MHMDMDQTERGLHLPRRGFLAAVGGLALGAAAGEGALDPVRGADAAPTVAPFSGRFIGLHLSAGGVGNTDFQYGRPHAYRFRAEKTGYITKVRYFNRYNSGGRTGYSSGNGGTIRIEIQTNSGGVPSGRVLGQTGTHNGLSIGRFPLLNMDRPAYVVEGYVYHMVFNQLSTSGWVSVNDLHFFAPSTPLSLYDPDFASLTRKWGSWLHRRDRHPIYELHYADGQVKGQGYLDAGRAYPQYVSGSSQLRQSIRAAVSRSTTQVSFRAWNTGGGGGMTVTLESPQGDRLASTYVSAGELSTSSGDRPGAAATRWVTKSWDRSVYLQAGTTYRVRFAASGGNFGFIPLQKGWRWGFREDKQQPIGQSTAGQRSFDSGRSWHGLVLYGKTNRDDLDLPVLLTLG